MRGRGAEERGVAGEGAERSFVEALLGEDLREDATHVGRRPLVARDHLDALEAHLLGMGPDRRARLQIADGSNRLRPVALCRVVDGHRLATRGQELADPARVLPLLRGDRGEHTVGA
ncbi:MAG TPA: hypothetical protein VLT33_30350 [Labilithrix sp.]|nr:hypothetical protein [Labilithrix sp.]